MTLVLWIQYFCVLYNILFQDGVILPSSASLYIAPFSDDEISERWADTAIVLLISQNK